MVQVLLVEDDDAIRSALTRGLAQLGHAVTAARTGAEAISSLSANQPDVILLDLGLPDIDGTAVLTMSQALGSAPVIVATARDDEREVVRLLHAGADDYVVKPFSAAQIDARIRAVLRRATPPPAEERTLTVGGLSLDPVGHAVHVDGVAVDLTRKEFDLLHVLMQHTGEVLSKPKILAEVWQLPWGGADRTVDVHLSWLRRKLGESAAEPRYIVSVRGVGVKLVAPEPW
ncbi:two-component system response regulator [Aeromicrobium sp. Root495]|uniref:response regulator transcription factor n=1 Tax=Aeromicrobium sp. Root495 TaxID=1736550 RepID=UPI0006F1C75B|nr:response regulator transcription factor [Aeromicrobium sp. Root495]KQY55371.1 two-component system response regulator [Aeromicrobium sp. Root495]